MIRSLRWRLLFGTIVVSGVMLAILGFGIDAAVRHILHEEFDHVLLEKARSLASMVEQDANSIHFDYEQPQFPEFELAAHSAYFQILLNGKPYQSSRSLKDGSLPFPSSPSPGRAIALTLPDGEPGRMLALPFQPYVEPEAQPTAESLPRPNGFVLVAQNTSELDGTLLHLRFWLLGMCASAAILSGLAMFMVVHAAVKPVRKLARDIELLPETELAAKLDGRALPEELVTVVDRLNGLLVRLAGTFDRERAITADIAHELRTPLAGLLATLEVCRSRPRDPAGYQMAIDKCLTMLSQMQRLVENLLLLARAEGSQLMVRTAQMDCAALLNECWNNFEPAAQKRGIASEVHLEPAAAITADAVLLRIIFNNLLDNAVSHVRDAGRIDLRALPCQSHLRVTIANTAHALAPADVAALGQRFWRKDAARSTTGIHAGLGLSLCLRLAALQHISLKFHVEANRFIVAIDIPLAAYATALAAI